MKNDSPFFITTRDVLLVASRLKVVTYVKYIFVTIINPGRQKL
jgi:hypothetical protein